MYSAIILKTSIKFVYVTFSDDKKFKVSVEIGEKIKQQLIPYFGCAYMPDWLSYDIPDSEIEGIETGLYQMFGKDMITG